MRHQDGSFHNMQRVTVELSFVLTSLPLLCFLCSTSLVKVIGFYTEDEPDFHTFPA